MWWQFRGFQQEVVFQMTPSVWTVLRQLNVEQCIPHRRGYDNYTLQITEQTHVKNNKLIAQIQCCKYLNTESI